MAVCTEAMQDVNERQKKKKQGKIHEEKHQLTTAAGAKYESQTQFKYRRGSSFQSKYH